MLIERFKEICSRKTWLFNYGAAHWQNLNDFPDDTQKPVNERQVYFLLLWKDRNFQLDDHSGITGQSYTGEFILCLRSLLTDKDYNFKYEDHIRHLEGLSESVFSEFSLCDSFRVTQWSETEVENVYDTNLDGLKIKFAISYEL